MKKLLLVILTTFCILALTACTNRDLPDDTQNNPPSDETQISFADLDSGAYAELIANQHYYIEYTIYLGTNPSTSVKEARDGKNIDTMGLAMGLAYRSLRLDNVLYNFMEADKTYTTYNIDENAPLSLEDSVQYQQMTYKESGTGAIPLFEQVDDAVYAYDEYSIPAATSTVETEMIMRFYLQADADGELSLYAIYSVLDGSEQTWIVDLLSADIPDGMLQLPSGYTNIGAI